MARATWLPDVLADEFRGVKGFQVELYDGWKTRGNASFAPIGAMNHHTGAGAYNNLLNYMARGSSISPLCNWATSYPANGIVRITIVAAGRANHAGRGRWGTWIPANNGNYRTIGGEHQNTGSQPWQPQHLEAIHRGTAAILRHLKQDESRAIDHKDYAPTRKWDRHTITLQYHQREVARFLSGQQQPAPTPAPEEDDDMITPDATGPHVEQLQHTLNRFIYVTGGGLDGGGTAHDRGGSHLKVDGQYGAKSQEFAQHAIWRAERNHLQHPIYGDAKLITPVTVAFLVEVMRDIVKQ